MAKRKKKKGKIRFPKSSIFLLGMLAILIVNILLQTYTTRSRDASFDPRKGVELAVYFLDVGQGDSELIRLPDGRNILIDTGTLNGANAIVKGMQDLNIQKIDFLLITHPHLDHIGGTASIIKLFNIGNIYMPRVARNQTPTNKTYENILKEIQTKNLTVTEAKEGTCIIDEENIKLKILSPSESYYENLNDYSIVAHLTYGEKCFLFTGDAEKIVEKNLLDKKEYLQADVLKVGHHGSTTSTTEKFLSKVAPHSAVISCAKGNPYGHPHKAILTRLKKHKIDIYRTDEQGTILALCNGKEILFQTGLPSYSSAA